MLHHPLACHRWTVRLGARSLTALTPRPGDGLRLSTNYFHGTWHLVSEPHQVRALRRLLWALSFDGREGTVVVLDGDVLEATPFDAAPSRPVLLYDARRTSLDGDDVRALLRALRARRHPEGTVKLRTPGLERSDEESARPKVTGERYRPKREFGVGTVCQLGPAIVLRGDAVWLRMHAEMLGFLERPLRAGWSEHCYLGDWSRERGMPGEVQVFGDYRAMLEDARAARAEHAEALRALSPSEREERLGALAAARGQRRRERRARERQRALQAGSTLPAQGAAG